MLLFFLTVSSITAQKTEIDSSLNELDWKMNPNWALMDSIEMYNRSFNVTTVTENKSKIPFDYCHCNHQGDTLSIWISNFSEGGIGIRILLFHNSFVSYIRLYSDIPEFGDEQENKYFIDYPVKKAKIILKCPVKTSSNEIIGFLHIKSSKIQLYDGKRHVFSGQFQCRMK